MMQTLQTPNIAKSPIANETLQASNNTQPAPTANFRNSLSGLGMPSGNNSTMMVLLALITQLIQQAQGSNTQSQADGQAPLAKEQSVTANNNAQSTDGENHAQVRAQINGNDGRPSAQSRLSDSENHSQTRAQINGNDGRRPAQSRRPTSAPAPAPANNSPQALNDVATTAQNTPVNLNVIANDTDPDGNPLNITQFSQPANGTVTQNGNQLVYTPNADFSGPDNFSYVVSDGRGGFATALATVNVETSNASPTATADNATTDSDQPVTLNVLDNDTDPDGDNLTVASFSQPANGTVTQNGNQLVYTPNAGFTGIDAFTYQVTDGNGGTSFATASVTVAAPAPTPAPVPAIPPMMMDTSLNLEIQYRASQGGGLANVHDVSAIDGGPVTAGDPTMSGTWRTITVTPDFDFGSLEDNQEAFIVADVTTFTQAGKAVLPGHEPYQIVRDSNGQPYPRDESGNFLIPVTDNSPIVVEAFNHWGNSPVGKVNTNLRVEFTPVIRDVNADGNTVKETKGNSETTGYFTPLILDLDGDGVETLNIEEGAQFDLLNNGSQQNVGWAGADDGLLVRDINNDGQINNGSELFGAATELGAGGTAADGFQALGQFDDNGDNVIDRSDAIFSELKVWQDSNSDGLTQKGELKSLAEHGFSSLNLNAQATDIDSNGNTIGLQSTATKDDQSTAELSDVWFQYTATKGSFSK